MAIASSSAGIDISTSTTMASIRSATPPNQPAIPPSRLPASSAISTAMLVACKDNAAP
ncbi:hypothetical protein D3C71_2071210 [compost metagenome]